MVLARDMPKVKVKCEDRNNPAVYAGRRGYVGIVEHAFNVSGIDLDYQVANTDDEYLVSAQGTIKSIELQFWLRETAFSVVEWKRAKAGVVALPLDVRIRLAEVEAHGHLRGVDRKDDRGVGRVIDRPKGR